MKKISAVIITHNEEDNIRDCLETLKWADEIVVVDSYSSDRTVDICKEYNANVFYNKWPGYVKQKNYALERTTNNWVISLDADERLSRELINEIIKFRDNGTGEYEGYYIRRQSYYLGKWINHCGWYPDYKLRFFNKLAGEWKGDDPHDYFELSGKTKYLNWKIYHYSYKDLGDHCNRINRYTSIMAEGLYRKGISSRTSALFFSPLFKFFNMYIFKLGFLDGLHGFIISVMGTYYIFLKHAKLRELTKKR